MKADTVLADKAFDADERVIEPLLAAGKIAVIPPKSNRKTQRDFDRELYKARHLIENFVCKLKQFRAIATRYENSQKLPRRHSFGGHGDPPQLRTGPRSPKLNQ
jgi:transposase